MVEVEHKTEKEFNVVKDESSEWTIPEIALSERNTCFTSKVNSNYMRVREAT